MRFRVLAILLLLAAAPCFAQTPKGVTFKVRIEATEYDKNLLLEKLNSNGQDHHMAFEPTSGPWQYRIKFNIYLMVAPDGARRSGARVVVYAKGGRDNSGEELFAFSRDLRVTDGGATNAVAKEIVKRLRELR